MELEADELLIRSVDLEGDQLRVEFVDGLVGTVPFEDISLSEPPVNVNRQILDDAGGRRVELSTENGETAEYPWDYFRRLLDPEFSDWEQQEREKARKKLGEHVRKLRRERSLSQQDVANRAGLDRTTVSRLERGIHQASFDTLHSLASALQIPIQRLVSIDDEIEESVA